MTKLRWDSFTWRESTVPNQGVPIVLHSSHLRPDEWAVYLRVPGSELCARVPFDPPMPYVRPLGHNTDMVFWDVQPEDIERLRDIVAARGRGK